jgi:hypothetical protein
MKTKTSVRTLACAAVLTLGAAGAAQAQDNVFWSVGMSAPGMQVGVSNAPVVVMRAPVYVQPRPVYYAPPVPVVYGYNGWGHRYYGEHVGYRGYGWRGEERFEHGHERYEHGREQMGYQGQQIGEAHVDSRFGRNGTSQGSEGRRH